MREIKDYDEFYKITFDMFDNSTPHQTDIYEYIEEQLEEKGYAIPENYDEFVDWVDNALYEQCDMEYLSDFVQEHLKEKFN
jgi:hypothetical protein